MAVTSSQCEQARNTLLALRALLQKEGETKYRRVIEAAIGELSNEDGTVNISGFDNARSVFKTMTAGRRGFAEYYIHRENEDERITANKELDDLRSKVWTAFDL